MKRFKTIAWPQFPLFVSPLFVSPWFVSSRTIKTFLSPCFVSSRTIKTIITALFISLISFSSVKAQDKKPLSQQMAATVMGIWKDSFALDGNRPNWSYDLGVILKGFEGTWKNSGDATYFNYIQKMIDTYVTESGDIRFYKKDDYNIDFVNNGKLLLLMYNVTGKEKYWKAASLLREQLRNHPRTNEGGFWHKKTYPYQMWLDGLYMGEPFYAEYSLISHDDTAFNDVANQFIWMEKHARDPKTGLLYHGWDESKKEKWSNPTTGTSPNFWARAMGWYSDAIVDVLDYFPADHPKRKELIAILNRLVTAIQKVQDQKTGLWYDVLDQPTRKGNYPEASACCQFVYAIAKGVRKGYLSADKISIAKKGYDGIVKTFIKVENGQTNLYGTVKVSGLGGKTYRDGSFEYYMSEPVIMNDPKGMGAFILASNEMELLPTLSAAKGKSILLDYNFNHETKKDITGATVQTHYIWEQQDNGGYSMFGHVFNKYGIQTKSTVGEITAEQLKKADIYFIIDPDWTGENKDPKYIEQKHIDAIYDWVKKGGVLMLFANDSGQVEFKHYNQLAEKFGIHFNEDHRNMVQGNKFEVGTFNIAAGDPIFKTAKKVYMKEICTQKLSAPAKALLSDNGDVIISMSKVGKGTVIAIGDPWIYNEYVDGRKLPAYLENYKGAEDLVKWLIAQLPKK